MSAQTAKQMDAAPSAEGLAIKVVNLTIKKRELEVLANTLASTIDDMEAQKLNGAKVPDTSYRKARQGLGDIESQLSTLDQLMANTQIQGEATIETEIKQHKVDTDAKRAYLRAEQRNAAREVLIPILARYYSQRESIVGLSFSHVDANYLGVNADKRRLLASEIEKLKSKIDMDNSIGGMLQNISNDQFRLRMGKQPTFAKLVVKAQAATE